MKFTLLLVVSLILCVISRFQTTVASKTTQNRKPIPEVADSSAASVVSVTDDQLVKLSEDLYKREVSLLNQISVNAQRKTRSSDTNDVAPEPLLKVSDKVLNLPTIAKLRALFDNYRMDTSVAEKFTKAQLQEQDDFLDAVLGSNVMCKTMSFLRARGIVTEDNQRDYLKKIWFTLYNGGQGALGSSGFERVFMYEVKNGQLIGLHNWCYFSEQEKARRLNYQGNINIINLKNKGEIHKNRFTHKHKDNDLIISSNTMFVGTSPELEMALYTICFEFKRGEKCHLKLGEIPFSIETEIEKIGDQVYIGSAFPFL